MDDDARKQVNSSANLGKIGEQAVELLLTRAKLNVQRVANENDIGRDLYVDLTSNGEVTGGVIAVQVRSITKPRSDGQWILPHSRKDYRLWLESNVPIFGVLYCDSDGSMHWINLGDVARREENLDEVSRSHLVADSGFGRPGVIIDDGCRLDVDLKAFVDAARVAIERSPFGVGIDLLSGDLERSRRAVFDCFAVGRHDVRPLLLLAACVRWLPIQARREAIIALSHAGHHPDIYWHESNWIADSIKRRLHERTDWSDRDIEAMIAVVDADIDDGGMGWGRGSIGQCVYHTLIMDENIAHKVRSLFSRSDDIITLEATALLTQYWASDAAPRVVAELQSEKPHAFTASPVLAELAEVVREHGWADIF